MRTWGFVAFGVMLVTLTWLGCDSGFDNFGFGVGLL